MSAHRLPLAVGLGLLAGGLGVAFLPAPARTTCPTGSSATTGAPASEAPSFAADIEAARDHVTADELLDRLARDRAGVVLVDVRPQDEFDAFHLAGSRRMDLPTLLGVEGEAIFEAQALLRREPALVVLVSNGMTHPAQAWVELARRGHANVRILEDGLEGLRGGLLLPPSLRGAITEAAATAALPRHQLARLLLLAPSAAKTPTPGHRYATDPGHLEAPTVVSVAWVRDRGAAVVIVDAREPDAYAAGHLPGAVSLPVKALRGPRGGVVDELLPAAELAKRLGALGLDADAEIVVYAGPKLQDATQAVLALVTLGHRRVAVLEGGFGAWADGGLPILRERPTPVVKTYVPRAGSDAFVVGLEAVKATLAPGAPTLVDVRPAEAYRGEAPSGPRAGHIPGSLSRPYTADLLASERGVYWRAPDDLRADYGALGLAPAAPVIVSCRTGHQASQTWFTLHVLLGYRDVRWYDGSFVEWAAQPDLPIKTGASRSTPK